MSFSNKACPIFIGTVACQAAQVIGRDNPDVDNLGRTEQDQEIINQTLPYLQVRI